MLVLLTLGDPERRKFQPAIVLTAIRWVLLQFFLIISVYTYAFNSVTLFNEIISFNPGIYDAAGI
jgi:hypothetical protein